MPSNASSTKSIPEVCQATRRCFAANVRRLAKGQGLSINALADRSGVSRAQMFNVLRGNSSPSLDWVSKVAPVLGVFAWELLVSPEVMQEANSQRHERPARNERIPAPHYLPAWSTVLPHGLCSY